MNYLDLDRDEFDAVVTGELTHLALHLEEQLNWIICDYFRIPFSRRLHFVRLLLLRDGLTFQDKIEIVRGMSPLFGKAAEEIDLKSLLGRIEEFKSWRNAMAHGRDASDDEDKPRLKVEIVTRSGKEKVLEITPESHEKMYEEVSGLVEETKTARRILRSRPKA